MSRIFNKPCAEDADDTQAGVSHEAGTWQRVPQRPKLEPFRSSQIDPVVENNIIYIANAGITLQRILTAARRDYAGGPKRSYAIMCGTVIVGHVTAPKISVPLQKKAVYDSI